MKLTDLIFEEENQVASASKAINNAITSIDDSMHYGVFAKAVAHILKDEYGSHNIKPFMETLHKELGIDENLTEDFNKFDKEAKELQKELEDTYNRNDIHVSMGQYSGKDRGYGKVSFMVRDFAGIPPAEWKNVKNFLEAKGYEITQDSNFYDEDDDRRWYPHLNFEFDINEAI